MPGAVKTGFERTHLQANPAFTSPARYIEMHMKSFESQQ